LRLVYVRAVLRCFFRLVELGLFARFMPFALLSSVLVVRSVLFLAEGMYWGGLETLRDEVRRLCRESNLAAAVVHIRRWLALASGLSLTMLVAAALWSLARPHARSGFDFLDLFVIANALRWGADVLLRTYHSGVYAVSRVYRPWWSLVLVDVAELATLLLACALLGPWGVGCSLLLVGALRASLSWWFTRKQYARLKLRVGPPRLWLRAARDRKASWRALDSLSSAAGNVIAQADALLVLGLLATPGAGERAELLAALFHVIAPLQGVSQVWARLFYFDFKRLEAWGSPFLLHRFEALLSKVAWIVALPTGLVTLLLMSALWRGPALLLAFELTCLGVVRSWLSLRHVRAYSLGDYRFLWRLLAGLLLMAAATPLLAEFEASVSLAALVVYLTLGLSLLGRSERELSNPSRHVVSSPSAWLSRLLDQRGPVRIGLVRVDRNLSSVGRVAHVLGGCLAGATVGRLGRDTLVWFDSQDAIGASDLAVATAGSLRTARLSPMAPNGLAALNQGLDGAEWRRNFAPLLCCGSEPADSVLQRFRQEALKIHPGLRIEALGAGLAVQALGLAASGQLRSCVLAAARGQTGFFRIDGKEVVVLAPAGYPRLLIVAESEPGRSAPWKAALLELIVNTELELTLLESNASFTQAALTPITTHG
jgi:hypothetical protein